MNATLVRLEPLLHKIRRVMDRLAHRQADWIERHAPPALAARLRLHIERAKNLNTSGDYGLWRDKRGLITIVGIIMTMITVIVYIAILPLITTAIEDAINNSTITGSANITLARLIPFLLLIAIILGIFAYGSALQQE